MFICVSAPRCLDPGRCSTLRRRSHWSLTRVNTVGYVSTFTTVGTINCELLTRCRPVWSLLKGNRNVPNFVSRTFNAAVTTLLASAPALFLLIIPPMANAAWDFTHFHIFLIQHVSSFLIWYWLWLKTNLPIKQYRGLDCFGVAQNTKSTTCTWAYANVWCPMT